MWNKPRISSSPSAFSLICPHSQLRSTQTQPSFPGISSPHHHREMSLSSHRHLCAKPNTHQAAAAAAMSTLNWPAVWVVRATNYFRRSRQQLSFLSFFDSCSNHIGAHNGVEHDSESMSHMQISANCPCSYTLERICTFPISHSGRSLIKNSTYGNTKLVREALLAGNRCSQVPTLNQPDGLSTNYLHWIV